MERIGGWGDCRILEKDGVEAGGRSLVKRVEWRPGGL